MIQQKYTTVHNYIEEVLPKIEKDANGKIKYPFLNITTGSHYTGRIFVWDHHHMGMRLAYAGKPKYMKNLIDNLIEYQTSDGYIPTVYPPKIPIISIPLFTPSRF
jgi:hypothetical protein